jgi:hypothetical protein
VSCPELLNRLHDFWRDFNTVNTWKFPELSPSSLQKWLDFELACVNYAEFARAEWMWSRKPRLLLGKGMSGYSLLVFLGLLLFLFPCFGILLAAVWFLAMFVVIAHDAVRVTRWRREYEVSIVRVIRSSRKNRK